MREIVHLQVGQCGNQIGSKVSLEVLFIPQCSRSDEHTYHELPFSGSRHRPTSVTVRSRFMKLLLSSWLLQPKLHRVPERLFISVSGSTGKNRRSILLLGLGRQSSRGSCRCASAAFQIEYCLLGVFSFGRWSPTSMASIQPVRTREIPTCNWSASMFTTTKQEASFRPSEKKWWWNCVLGRK